MKKEKIRLLNLDPVTVGASPEELDYIGKYLSEDTVLESWAIRKGPASIECEYDEAMAQPEILRLAKQAEGEGFDGIFVDCFGDPAVRAARECVDIPVFGGFEPVIHLSLGIADRIAIITVLPDVIPMLRGSVARAGLEKRVTEISSVDIPVLELQDRGRLLKALYEKSAAAVRTGGAEAIVLGCTAMIDVAEELEGMLQKENFEVPVLEAAQSALMMLELHIRMGLRHSRRTYRKVRNKDGND